MLQCTLHIDRLLCGVYMLYLQPEELLHWIIKKSGLLLVHEHYLLACKALWKKYVFHVCFFPAFSDDFGSMYVNLKRNQGDISSQGHEMFEAFTKADLRTVQDLVARNSGLVSFISAVMIRDWFID